MSIAVVEKTFDVLEVLSESKEPMPLARLAERTKLPKPTAYRVLQTLVKMGYVAQDDSTEYYLTSKLSSLGQNVNHRDLKLKYLPEMEQLYRLFNETINLGVLHGSNIHYVHVLETTRPLRMMAQPNVVDEFYSTAIGKAIVSHLPEEEQRALIRAVSPHAVTTHTIVKKIEIEKMLKETRKRGWAFEEEETTPGVSCLGIPILEDGYPVAGISITVPKSRLTPERKDEIVAALTSLKMNE